MIMCITGNDEVTVIAVHDVTVTDGYTYLYL